jgi:hypothetical protein
VTPYRRLVLIQSGVGNLAGQGLYETPPGYSMPTYNAALRTFYVDATGGSDSYTTTQAQNPATPWATIGMFNAVATAGDHVNLKGTFSVGYTTGIRPAGSGTATNKIVYRNWLGYSATVSYDSGDPAVALWLNGRSHVACDGIAIGLSGSRYVHQMGGGGASNNWFLRCDISGGSLNCNGAPDCKVYETTFHDIGARDGNTGDGVFVQNGSHRFAFVGNNVVRCGHAAGTISYQGSGEASCDDCVFSYNQVNNTWAGGFIFNGKTVRVLCEHNDIWASATVTGGFSIGSKMGIEIQGVDGIYRRNRIWGGGGTGIQLQAYVYNGFEQVCTGNRVYHNVIHGNNSRPIDLFVNLSSMTWSQNANNIIENNVCWGNHTETYESDLYGISGGLYYHVVFVVSNGSTAPDASLNGNIIRNNLMSRVASGTSFARVINTNFTLESFQSTYAACVANLTGQDPLFVSESAPDYRLQAGSPCINAGAVISGQSYLGSAPDMGAYERE